MKRLLVLTAASLFALGLAPTAIAGAQQDKMKSCNAEAKTKALKGDERKAFMKECLSAKKAEEPKTAEPKAAEPKAAEPKAAEPKAKATQQEKMKSCNTDAKTKGLKGDERKKFMSECLKG
jgi:hypothetical protein